MMKVIALLLCSLVLCDAQFSTSITAVLPDSTQVSVTIAWYPGLTVANAMIQAVTASNAKFNYAVQYSSALYGGFITEVCNVPNAAPMYWLYEVNGVAAQVGADFYALQDNDEVVWNYTKTTLSHLKTNFIPSL